MPNFLRSRRFSASFSSPLPAAVENALLKLGISSLYSHQTQAIEHIRSGRHTVVATPTSSGKSLIYNLAVAKALIGVPGLHALYLFPIKALARDQLDSLHGFFDSLPGAEGGYRFTSCIYDGDTTPYQRAAIRQRHPDVLFTNPDMLHYALLAFHHKWEGFWKKLRYVIVKNAHLPRDFREDRVAQVFRRLRRICRHYGSSPQFILLSATIGNPDELAGRLTGVAKDEIAVVSGASGAPQAKRHFVFLRPEESRSGTHWAWRPALSWIVRPKRALRQLLLRSPEN